MKKSEQNIKEFFEKWISTLSLEQYQSIDKLAAYEGFKAACVLMLSPSQRIDPLPALQLVNGYMGKKSALDAFSKIDEISKAINDMMVRSLYENSNN